MNRWSYAELLAAADAVAEQFASLGLTAPDRLVLQLPNSADHVVVTLACWRSGLLPVMALPAHRRTELTHLATVAEAAAIVVPGELRGTDHATMAGEVMSSVPALRHVVVAGGDPKPWQTGLIDVAAGHQPVRHPVAPDASDVALFLLSGGTTGLPKLIPRTHDDYAYNAAASALVTGLDETSRYLVSLPAGHNFPLACPGILGTLLSGGRVVLTPSPDAATAFDLIASQRVTHTAVVPAILQRWLDFGSTADADLSALRLIQVGGARLAPELARRVGGVLGCDLQQVFGMAEGLLNYTRLDDPADIVCETQGRPLSPDDEIRLVGPDGESVADGTPGLLLTRGPYTVRGYYRAPEHNRSAFTADGWYRTGDVVRRHPSGNLVVEGRDKDLINRAGEKISAETVEDVLHALPEVARAAAVAKPDPSLGERVAAFVVARPGATITLDSIRAAFEDAGLARFCWPEHLELVDRLPLTAVGKVDKRALRERLAATDPAGA